MNNFIINKEEAIENLLSKKYYFQSLLQLSYLNDLLSVNDMESIQLQLVETFTETVGYFTKGKSSSVKEETAEQLILAIYYKLGLFLKSQPTIKERLDLIRKKKLKSLLAEGEEILEAKVNECKVLFETVKETRLQTDNYAYLDTMDYGIPLFFEEYDIRFACHETPGSIDYPLAIDEVELIGIEYIEDYLNKLILENTFCSYFDKGEIKALLKGFYASSEHMLINVFQLVLTNYLGCILIGKEERSLEITKGDRVYLKSIMEDLSPKDLDRLVHEASEKICEELFIKDKNLIEYINKTIFNIARHMKINIETNTLENVFVTLSESEKDVLKYVDGKSLDNSSFRNMIEEIRDCSKVKDKIGIIREEIHSLEDLVDVLGADCIFGDEFIDIFKALDDFEIALLIKRLSNDEVWDNEYGTESEKEWHEKLKIYLEGLDYIKKEEIISISQGIAIV